jgi:hypothetical protein
MFGKRISIVFAVASLVLGHVAVADNLSSSGTWVYFADTVMGGKSQGAAERLTTSNNGGFVQVRRDVKTGQESDFVGISFEAKGNGETYYIHIRNGSSRLPWQYYSASFITSDTWRTVEIPFSNFKRSGSFMSKSLKKTTIHSLGLVAYGKDHQALVLISNLSFY